MKFNSLNRWVDSTTETNRALFMAGMLFGSFLVGGILGICFDSQPLYLATTWSIQIAFIAYRYNWLRNE